MTYKVGNIVEITKGCSCGCRRVGELATILEVYADAADFARIRVHRTGSEWDHLKKEMKLHKHKKYWEVK